MIKLYLVNRKDNNAFSKPEPRLLGMFFSIDEARTFMQTTAQAIVTEEKIPIREQKENSITLADIGNLTQITISPIQLGIEDAPWGDKNASEIIDTYTES